MIKDPKSIVYELEKALYLAKNGRKGPVWLDIPLDIQNMRIEPENLEHFSPKTIQSDEPKPIDIKYIVDLFNTSQRPAILIGSGVKSAEALEDLQNFMKDSRIPLTYSASAVDTYGLKNNLSIGSVGIMGCSRAGNFVVQNADLILVLGSRLNSMTVGECGHFAREAKVHYTLIA